MQPPGAPQRAQASTPDHRRGASCGSSAGRACSAMLRRYLQWELQSVWHAGSDTPAVLRAHVSHTHARQARSAPGALHFLGPRQKSFVDGFFPDPLVCFLSSFFVLLLQFFFAAPLCFFAANKAGTLRSVSEKCDQSRLPLACMHALFALSLSLSHTHTHTHTLTHSLTRSLARSLVLALALALSVALSFSLACSWMQS